MGVTFKACLDRVVRLYILGHLILFLSPDGVEWCDKKDCVLIFFFWRLGVKGLH